MAPLGSQGWTIDIGEVPRTRRQKHQSSDGTDSLIQLRRLSDGFTLKKGDTISLCDEGETKYALVYEIKSGGNAFWECVILYLNSPSDLILKHRPQAEERELFLTRVDTIANLDNVLDHISVVGESEFRTITNKYTYFCRKGCDEDSAIVTAPFEFSSILKSLHLKPYELFDDYLLGLPRQSRSRTRRERKPSSSPSGLEDTREDEGSGKESSTEDSNQNDVSDKQPDHIYKCNKMNPRTNGPCNKMNPRTNGPCNKLYHTLILLIKHQEYAHDQKGEFHCPLCSKAYTITNSLRRHLESTHNKGRNSSSEIVENVVLSQQLASSQPGEVSKSPLPEIQSIQENDDLPNVSESGLTSDGDKEASVVTQVVGDDEAKGSEQNSQVSAKSTPRRQRRSTRNNEQTTETVASPNTNRQEKSVSNTENDSTSVPVRRSPRKSKAKATPQSSIETVSVDSNESDALFGEDVNNEDPNQSGDDSAEEEDDDEDEEESLDSDSDDVEFFSAESSPKKRKAGKSPKKTPKKSPKKTKLLATPTKKSSEIDKSVLFIENILGKRKHYRILVSKPESLPNIVSPRKKKKEEVGDYELVDTTSNAFRDLRQKLHTSTKLASLPCREDEFTSLYLNLESSIREQTGCCLYVSGTPGIGKTATIREVMAQMKELEGEIGEFQYFELNALKLISPNYAYTELWSKISGIDVSPNNAAMFLETYFKEQSKEKKTTVVMVDELDQIATKKQNVMYNFFNWPTYPHSKLIVIAVANTMDLPERVLSNKISSRLGLKRIQFLGYTFEQLGTIIEHRLDMIKKSAKHRVIIDRDAVNYASRKVASVSGDARRALTICKRAVEIAETEFRNKRLREDNLSDDEELHVKIEHIAKAINETINSPIAQYISSLSFGSKLLLCALLLRMKRSGLSDNPVGDIIDEIRILLRTATSKHLLFAEELTIPIDMSDALFDGKLFDDSKSETNIRIENFRFLLLELTENGIINAQDTKSERYRNISLNVSREEVLVTLKRDPQVSGFL